MKNKPLPIISVVLMGVPFLSFIVLCLLAYPVNEDLFYYGVRIGTGEIVANNPKPIVAVPLALVSFLSLTFAVYFGRDCLRGPEDRKP